MNQRFFASLRMTAGRVATQDWLVFLFRRIGFNLRLFIVLGLLSVLFVTLTLFTGRQSTRTLILELQYASEALDRNSDAAANELSADSRHEG